MNQSVLAIKKGSTSEIGKSSRSIIESSASTSLTAIEQEKKSALNSFLTTLSDTLVSLQDRRQKKGWKSFLLDTILNSYLIYCSILIPTLGDYNWGPYGAWIFEVLNYPITLAWFRLPYIAAVIIMFVSLVMNVVFFGYYLMFARRAIENASPSTEKIRPIFLIWGQVLFYSSMFSSFVVSSFVDCSENIIVDKAQVFKTLTIYSSEKCYGTTNLIFMSFGLLNLLCLLGIISFSAITSNETNPLSTILFSAESTMYKVVLIVSTAIQLVIPYFIPSTYMYARAAFHLVFTTLYIPILFIELPFFHRVNNSIFSGIAFARVGSSLGAIISSSVNTTSAWDLGLGTSGICLALIAIGFIVGFIVMEIYTRVICYRVRNVFHSRMNGTDHEMDAMEKEAISLLQYFESNNELRKLNMFLRFALKSKRKTDEFDDITLAISFTKGIAGNKMFVDPQLLMTCSMIFSYYCQGQPNNITYSHLLLSRGLKQRPNLITKLKIRQRIKDLDTANVQDLESIVRAEHKTVIEKLEKDQKRLYALHKQFWKELIAQNTDLVKIETINRCIAQLTEKCNDIFVNILSTRSAKNDKNLLRMYGKFLEELCFNKDQAEELYEEATSIEEDEINRRGRNSRKVENSSMRSKNKVVPLPTNPSANNSRNSISFSHDQFQKDLGAEETLEDIENMLGVAVDDVKKKNSMINIALSSATSNLPLKVFFGVLIVIGLGLLVSSIVLESILVGNTVGYVPLVDTVCLPAVASLNGINKLRMRQLFYTRDDPSAAADITKATNFWKDSRQHLVNMKDTLLNAKLSKEIYTQFSKPVHTMHYPHLEGNTTFFTKTSSLNSSINDITNAEIENFDRQWDKTSYLLTETRTSFSFMFLWDNGLTVSSAYTTFCGTLISSVSAGSVENQDIFLKYFAACISTYFALCIFFFIFSLIRLGLLERAIRMYSKVIPKDISGKVFHDLSKKVDDDSFGNLPSKFSNPKYIISISAILLTVICCIALVVAFLDLKNQSNTILQNMANIKDGIELMSNLQLMEFGIRELFLYTKLSKYNISITPPELLGPGDMIMLNEMIGSMYNVFFMSWNRLFYGDTAQGVDPLVGLYPEIDAILKGTNCSASVLKNVTACEDYIGLAADVATHLINLKRYPEFLNIDTEPVSYTTLVALTRKTQTITLHIIDVCELIISNTVYDLTLILIYTIFAIVSTIILAYLIHNTIMNYETNQKHLRMMLNYIPEDQIECSHELKTFVLNHQLPNILNKFSKKKVGDDSTSKLTGILDSAVDGVCLCKQSNDDFSLEYINPSAQRMFGVQANEVAGASLYSLFDAVEGKKVGKSIDFLLSTTSAAQKGETIEVECMRKNGSSFSSKLNIFVTSFNGKPVVSCFIKDITPEKKQNTLLAEEKKKSEALLRNIMPDAVASRLKSGETFIAEKFNDVSVFFSDMVGFTKISSNMQANELVLMLNAIVNEFDSLTDKYHLEKVKTIGDAYFCVGGIHGNSQSDHPERMLRFSIDTLTVIRNYNKGLFANCLNVNDIENTHQINIRIGLNTGPVIAGVIGTKKFAYDFWGDTINTASRMESNSKPGRIQLSRPTYERVYDLGLEFEERHLDVKGKGMCATYLLKENHHEKGLLSKDDLMELVRENVLRNEGGVCGGFEGGDGDGENSVGSSSGDLEVAETSQKNE